MAQSEPPNDKGGSFVSQLGLFATTEKSEPCAGWRGVRIFLFFAARIRFRALRFLAVHQKKEGSERPKGSPEPRSVRKRRLRRRLKRRGVRFIVPEKFFQKIFPKYKTFFEAHLS